MMADNTIIITKDQMRQIARYELTFKEILDGMDFDDAEISCPEVYSFTLEDLYQALRNLKEADPTVHNFGDTGFTLSGNYQSPLIWIGPAVMKQMMKRFRIGLRLPMSFRVCCYMMTNIF